MVVVLPTALSASLLLRQAGTGKVRMRLLGPPGGLLELAERERALGDLIGLVVLHALGGGRGGCRDAHRQGDHKGMQPHEPTPECASHSIPRAKKGAGVNPRPVTSFLAAS